MSPVTEKELQEKAKLAARSLDTFFHLQFLVELSSVLSEYLRDIPFGEMVRFMVGYCEPVEGFGLAPFFDGVDQVDSESNEFRGPAFYLVLFDLLTNSVQNLINYSLETVSVNGSNASQKMDDVLLSSISFKRMLDIASGSTIELITSTLEERGLKLCVHRAEFVHAGEQLLRNYREGDLAAKLDCGKAIANWLERSVVCTPGPVVPSSENEKHSKLFVRWLRDEMREQFLSMMGLISLLVVTPVRRYHSTSLGEVAKRPGNSEFIIAQALRERFDEEYIERSIELLRSGSATYTALSAWMKTLHRGLLNAPASEIEERVAKAVTRLLTSIDENKRLAKSDAPENRIQYSFFLSNHLNSPVPSDILRWIALNLYSLSVSRVEAKGILEEAHSSRKLSFPKSSSIAQALTGLEYSETLAYTCKKRYRDHLAHSCRVALLGLVFFDSYEPQTEGGEIHKDRDMRSVTWLYISLLHDCGYILEHLDYLFGLVDNLAETPTFKSFSSNLEHARGHLIYALSVALGKDPCLQDKFQLKSVQHAVVSYDNALRILGPASQESPLRIPSRAIALHHSYQYIPLNPETYGFWLALVDESQEWGRAVAVPPDIAQFVQALLATGNVVPSLATAEGSVEVQNVVLKVAKDEKNELGINVSITLPGATDVFARTLFNPLYFIWSKFSTFCEFGASVEHNCNPTCHLFIDVACQFISQSQIDDWLRYFSTLKGILEREVQHTWDQLKGGDRRLFLGEKHIDGLNVRREIGGALLILCQALEKATRSTPPDLPSIRTLCRIKVEPSRAGTRGEISRGLEFQKGYTHGREPGWISLEDVATEVANKGTGVMKTDPNCLAKPSQRILVTERIEELHEAALGSLIGRHQAREIVEKYGRFVK